MDEIPEKTEVPLASKSAPILNYGRPSSRPSYFFTEPVGVMIFISIGWLLAIVFLYALTLDDGARMRRVNIDFLAYALVATTILVRRGRNLTKADLAFIGFGYPAFVVITEAFF